MRRLALALLLLAGCHSAKPGTLGQLRLLLDPPQLRPGALVTVTAVPEPMAELAWVSGTVKVMGAATLPFRRDPADGQWKFKTMIPAFVSIPSGTYEAVAWGETGQGRRFEGSLKLDVK